MTVPTAGARVRITIEGVVSQVQGGEIALTDGTTIEYSGTGPAVEILTPGFQPGDVVHAGDRHLLRVRDESGTCYWSAPDGFKVWDDQVDASRLTIVARAGDRPEAAE